MAKGKLETGGKASCGFLGPKKGFMLSSLVTKPLRPVAVSGGSSRRACGAQQI